MSLSDLFSLADSQYQALAKNPPRGEWSIVVLASFSYPIFANYNAPIVRGRLEYSPYHAVETKVGNRVFLLLSPAKFSGQITATTSDGPDTSNPTVSVTIAAPTALFFQAGKYEVEVSGQDPLLGAINLNDAVTDNPSDFSSLNNAQGIQGAVQIYMQDAHSNNAYLTLWGAPYRYPIPIIPLPHG